MSAPPPSVVRVACAQLAPVIGDLEGNRRRALAAIDEAARLGARLVVLPELCTSGYVFSGVEEARSLAEPADGESVTGWCARATATGMVIVGGFCEFDPDRALRNSAVIVDETGVRALYRKAHLWGAESQVFLRGDRPAPVVETAIGRVGIAVCYDSAFPEHARRAALDGAEIIAVPLNSPAPERPTRPVPIEVAIAMTTANANRVWIVQADRTGTERGVRWAEASVVVDPDGDVVAGPLPGEQLLIVDADIARARDKAWGPHNDVLADRRPELY